MSVSADSSPGLIRRGATRAEPESGRYRYFAGLVVTVDLFVLIFLAGSDPLLREAGALDLGAWIGLTIVASLAPVPSGRGAWLAFDLPVVVGAGLVLGPLGAGVVGLVGACDIREVRRELSLSRAVFNRAQVSLCGVAGAWIFGVLGGELGDWPMAAFLGLLAVATDCLLNYTLVAMSSSLRLDRAFRSVLSDMYVGAKEGFLVAYVGFGFLAVLLAEAYSAIGVGGLVAFAIPLLLARQLFQHRYRLAESDGRLRQGEVMLSKAQSSISQGRRDERMILAGELHDEVLPPLFKVHLMGQVLRQDLNTGRLLDLDDDLPELLEATEVAQLVVRDLVRNLRRSSLGPRGLVPSLEMTVRQLEAAGSASIELDVPELRAPQPVQLVLYQVAKEAMVNAAKYSRASKITVRVMQEDEVVRLVVADDGVGFDPGAVDRDNHFGLQFVADRVEALGGRVIVDSRLGSGTTVSATLPNLSQKPNRADGTRRRGGLDPPSS